MSLPPAVGMYPYQYTTHFSSRERGGRGEGGGMDRVAEREGGRRTGGREGGRGGRTGGREGGGG